MKSLIASFRVKFEAVDQAKTVIAKFLAYVEDNEPGTLLYRSFQHEGDPCNFTHFMTFKSEKAELKHKQSAACKAFVKELYPLCEIEPMFHVHHEVQPS